jgi:cell division protein FtsB
MMKYKKSGEQKVWRRFLRSRSFIAVNLAVLGFVGWLLINESSGGRRVALELEDLRAKMNRLEKEAGEYQAVMDKLGTDGFVEREARLKIGYQKPGEQVLLIRDAAGPMVAERSNSLSATSDNPQKWWEYFFGG